MPKLTPQPPSLLIVLAVLIALTVLAVYALRAVRTRRDLYVLSPEDVNRHEALYALLVKVDGVLRRHKIKYWPVGGTMLGAVRHGKIIPWDDDIDLAVWWDDVPRLAQALETDLPGQVGWWQGPRCYKITPANRHDTVIDIFPSKVVLEASGQRRVVFASELARKAWPAEFFTESEFGGAQTLLAFGPVAFQTPDRPCSYLDRVFPGWDQRGYNTEAHSGSVFRQVRAAIAPATYVFNATESRRHC